MGRGCLLVVFSSWQRELRIEPFPDATRPVDEATTLEWRARARQFFEEAFADEAAEKTDVAKARKYHRIATSDLMCGGDWQLYAMLNTGWVHAVVTPEDQRVPLAERKRITIVWDMGPDNLCATAYILRHRKMRVTIFSALPTRCKLACGVLFVRKGG